ncbi:MAG: hypothetical protein OXC82_05435 [Rhodobacteraceae bacterium]|nr:hypothetical protein [Paracoccaceae bacterium]MCY4249865.1 hypothetical protein [Paracoccaceae bacterium]
MGSHTSYIRERSEEKNIVYPYSEYGSHWILGFACTRNKLDKDLMAKIYDPESIGEMPLPFGDIDVFMQEKWKIAGDRTGSGNTRNIGSIRGSIGDFRDGNGVFESEGEFLAYCRGYRKKAEERKNSYSNISEFRSLKRT